MTAPTSHLDDHETSRLQVIICYGEFFSNHAAMRLSCPGQHTLFWDPGGAYGEDDPSKGRQRDLILADPPSIDRWWQYRRDSCNEPIMAVYEWDLSPDSARQLHTVLIDGADRSHPRGAFQSDVAAWMCCKAICDYLDRFFNPPVTVSKRWVLPLNLGKHLWTQTPDRVRIYRSAQPPRVYVCTQNDLWR